MANHIHGTTQNTVKKQLNDFYLSISFEKHKELNTLSVDRVTGDYNEVTPTTASGTQLTFKESTGTKEFQKGPNGHNGLDQTDGEAVLLIVGNPVSKKDITLEIPITTVDGGVSGTQTITVKIDGYSGKNQATFLGDDAPDTDIILNNITQIGDGTPGGGIVVTGAKRGDNFKFMSVPKEWTEQSFVRSITPDIPKDYAEVADHFDGAADIIRVTTIKGLTFSKVFEDMPGSFQSMIYNRTLTIKAEARPNDVSVPTEVHYFLGVRGTGRVNLNLDAQSITEAECSVADWVYVTTL